MTQRVPIVGTVDIDAVYRTRRPKVMSSKRQREYARRCVEVARALDWYVVVDERMWAPKEVWRHACRTVFLGYQTAEFTIRGWFNPFNRVGEVPLAATTGMFEPNGIKQRYINNPQFEDFLCLHWHRAQPIPGGVAQVVSGDKKGFVARSQVVGREGGVYQVFDRTSRPMSQSQDRTSDLVGLKVDDFRTALERALASCWPIVKPGGSMFGTRPNPVHPCCQHGGEGAPGECRDDLKSAKACRLLRHPSPRLHVPAFDLLHKVEGGPQDGAVHVNVADYPFRFNGRQTASIYDQMPPEAGDHRRVCF